METPPRELGLGFDIWTSTASPWGEVGRMDGVEVVDELLRRSLILALTLVAEERLGRARLVLVPSETLCVIDSHI